VRTDAIPLLQYSGSDLRCIGDRRPGGILFLHSRDKFLFANLFNRTLPALGSISHCIPGALLANRRLYEVLIQRILEFENTGLMEELFQQGCLVDLEYRLYTKEEAQRTHIFYLDLTQDAIFLVDRDGFFAAKLEQVRQRMRELGTRRVYFEDGCWYWELKPGMQPGEVVEL